MTLSLQNIYVYVSECMHVRAQDSQKRASAPLRLEYRQYELATSQVLDTEPRSSAEWPVLAIVEPSLQSPLHTLHMGTTGKQRRQADF